MPSKSSKSGSNGILAYASIIVIIAAILAAILYVYRAQKLASLPQQESQVGTPTTQKLVPTPTPTPTKLFHGKDTYTVSGGAPNDPHFSEVSIDPMDPNVGGTQVFTVKITSTYAVNKAWLSIRTDVKTTKLPLTMISGTPQNGMWTATWSMPESYLYNYQITPSAQTAYSQGSATITVRQRP